MDKTRPFQNRMYTLQRREKLGINFEEQKINQHQNENTKSQDR